MKRVLTSALMKRADKNTTDVYGIASLVLMERAALRSMDILLDEACGFDLRRVLIIAGTGNNGGDALALGRLLVERGIKSNIYTVGDISKATPEFLSQQKTLKAYNADIKSFALETADDQSYTTVIDGLFGISLGRDVSGVFLDAVKYMNLQKEAGARVLSLDMPSGINADTALVMGDAVRADVTVTFGFYKTGQLLYPGADYCGKLVLCPIGIPENAISPDGRKDPLRTYILEESEMVFPERPAHSHKGTFGKVLLIAGSAGMCGAAILSGLAAMRAGAGMLRIITHEANRDTINRIFPEAMLTCYGDDKPVDESELEDDFTWCDCIAAGPGLGTSDTAAFLVEKAVGQDMVPVVADADALNILAKKPDLFGRHSQDIIITPHAGEMGRLIDLPAGEVSSHLIDTALDFAMNYDVITVLKDARTVTALPTGKCIINTCGNSGMATAGSGDVLTGIIAALLARGIKPYRAAYLGVALHSRAGDRGSMELSEESLLARDIIRYLND